MTPDLGALLLRRQRRAFNVFFALLSGFAGLLLSGLGVFVLVDAFVSPRPPGPPWWFCFIPGAMGAGLLIASYHALRRARTQLCFHELGAIETRGRRSVLIRYADIRDFAMIVQHDAVHGVYAGSRARLTLRSVDGSIISYTGPFKVRVKGLFKRQYDAADDLDAVKWLIAERMADVMLERLSRDDWDWSANTAFTPTGLRLADDSIVPYAAVDPQETPDGRVAIKVMGRSEAAAIMPTGNVNFWPYLALMLRLRQMHAD